MDVSLSEQIEWFVRATRDHVPVGLRVLLESVPEGYYLMLNIDPLHPTNTVSLSAEQKMQLLTLMARILELEINVL